MLFGQWCENQPNINQQLNWLQRPEQEVWNFFQILNFCTGILFITNKNIYSSALWLYLVYQDFLYVFNSSENFESYCFTFFSSSCNIKSTSVLLLGITLNIPESMHVSFVILSTCEMCKYSLLLLLLLINNIIWNRVKTHGFQRETI